MTNLNVNELKHIAEENETSKAIFTNLSTRKRSRARIDIRALKYELLVGGQKVVEEQFLDTFKKLMDMGVGSLIIGRKGKPTRFVWNYKLRDVTSAAASKVEAKSVRAKRGRPFGAKTMNRKAKPVQKEPEVKKAIDKSPISITFNLSANTRGEDLAALISLAKELESK